MNFPELNYKKCYHAGDTRDHLNNNIEIAVRGGSVRIGHGLNIIQRIEFLPHCSNVCFELNPISNLITAASARLDLRLSSAPILLGLGYPVSISPDDPGKFGYEDTTVDFFASAVSFNWTLKHLKLVAIHSINHSICTEGARLKLLRAFTERWQSWIEQYLSS
jgi:adenosine deaminase